MEKRDYYVYKHTNKTNGKCYIGISCQEPEQRWRNGLGYKDQSKFYGAILKYGWDGFNHEILYNSLTQKEAYDLEKELIARFDSIENGYNIQSGGEDVGIWARDYLSMPIYQIDPNDLHVIFEFDSISDAAREFNIAPTGISKAIQENGTSAGYYWVKVSDYNDNWVPRNNQNESSIYKIDSCTFAIVDKYKSITEAAKKNGLSVSGLHRCHEFFSLGGYCWCKCSEWHDGWRPSRKPNTATPVYQIEVESLKILNEWPSIVEASKVLGINKVVISRCCQRKGIIAGGYHWCRVEDWNSDWEPKEIGKIGSDGREVYQIDKETLQIINKYKNATEASKAVGVSNASLSKAAGGSGTESAGCYWCYVDLYDNWQPKQKKKTGIKGKPVIQTDTNGNPIKEWGSIKEAADFYHISASVISNVCAGRCETAAGYKWKRK